MTEQEMIDNLFSLPDKDGNHLMIFAMNDYDWWADYGIEPAIVNYTKFQHEDVGLDHDEIEIKAHALSKDEANSLKFCDPDENATRTFAEKLKHEIDKGEKFPNFFASTEY